MKELGVNHISDDNVTDKKGDNKDNTSVIAHLEGIRASTEKEFVDSQNRRSTYLIQLIIALGAIAAAYISSANSFLYAPFILLILPLLTIFYVTLMAKASIMEDIMVKYLRDNLEPKLAEICNINEELEYEIYWNIHHWKKIDSHKGNPSLIPIRQIYLILMWSSVLSIPMIVIYLLDQKGILSLLFKVLIYVYALICIFLAIRNTIVLLCIYREKMHVVIKNFDITFTNTFISCGLICIFILLTGVMVYPNKINYLNDFNNMVNLIESIKFLIFIHLSILLFIFAGIYGGYLYIKGIDIISEIMEFWSGNKRIKKD